MYSKLKSIGAKTFNNSPISGESFFEPLPKASVAIEQFSTLDNSVIWHLNHLFWKYFDLWQQTYGEHYEASLPSGVSESHTQAFVDQSVQKFITLLTHLEQQDSLPETLYVLEQGPGTGQYARLFLDKIRDYSKQHDRPFYKKMQYLLFDTSAEILKSAVANLADHKKRVTVVTKLNEHRGQVLFVRHSNLWDQLPVKIFASRNGQLSELQVQPVLSQEIAAELQELGSDYTTEQIAEALNTRTIESLIVKEPRTWKPLVRALFLKTNHQAIAPEELESRDPSGILQRLAQLHDGQEFVFNQGVLQNITELSSLINWELGGYIEVVDIVVPTIEGFDVVRRPKKYDGSLASFINGAMLRVYCEEAGKYISFERIRGLNHIVTIRQHSLQALLRDGHFTTIAEIAASKTNSLDKTLHNARHMLSQGIDIIAFSDQALVKSEYFKLSELIDMKLFEQLPAGSTLPVLKARTKSKREVAIITQDLKEQHVKNLFVVTGDPSFESDKTLQTSLEVLPTVSPHFFTGGVAHPQASDIPKTIAKIKAGAQFLIMQAIYDQDEWNAWATAIKRHDIHKQVPIIAVVMPIVSRRTLEVVRAIKDVSISDAYIAEFDDLNDEQIRSKGLDDTKAMIRQYKESDIFSGIYIYSRSAETILTLNTYIRTLD